MTDNNSNNNNSPENEAELMKILNSRLDKFVKEATVSKRRLTFMISEDIADRLDEIAKGRSERDFKSQFVQELLEVGLEIYECKVKATTKDE